MRDRPFGVTLLAVGAGVLAVIAGLRVLQFLGLFPFFFGPIPFRTFSLFAALMYALLVWVYIWLVQMLWNMEESGWLFLVVISIFNLTLEFMALVGGAVMGDVSASLIINALILIYCMLPGVRKSFGQK